MVGTTVSQYRIVVQLGQGGMGVVYRAVDTRLDRDAALKFLPPHLSGDAGAKARFIQEAKAASGLDHPNICTIYDIGETREGRLYIAMAFYEGQTLKYRLNDGPLPIEEALKIVVQVAQGLELAHNAGIVHRDIKPANIMVTDRAVVKLLDFGVAKLEEGLDLTEVGSIVGTVAYMSPEQSQGGLVDRRSDLWSLGVVLYEMLTGQRPFDASYDQATVYAIQNQAPEPVTTLRPEVPAVIVDVLDRLLAKRPEDRPASASDVLAVLQPLVGSSRAPRADVVGSPSRAEILMKPGRRTRTRTLILSSALVFIAVLALWLVRRMGDAAQTALPYNHIAVFPFVVNGDASLEYLGEGFVNLLGTKIDGTDNLSTVDPHALIGRAEQRRGSVLTPDEGRAMAASLGAGSFILGSITRLADDILLDAALYSDRDTIRVRVSVRGEREMPAGVDQLAQGLVARRVASSVDPLRTVAAMTTSSFEALKAYLEGERYWRNMDRDKAHDAFKRAITADSTFALGWYRYAQAIRWGGGTYSVSGQIEARRRALDRALQYRDELPRRVQTLIRAAEAFEQGQVAEAEELYARRIEQDENDVDALLEYGDLLFSYNPLFGRSAQEARPVLERVLALDANHPVALNLLTILAVLRDDEVTVRALAAQQEAMVRDGASAPQQAEIAIASTLFEGWDSLYTLFEDLQSPGLKRLLVQRLSQHRQWDIAEDMVKRLEASTYSEQSRDIARWLRTFYSSARGRPMEADSIAAEARSVVAWVLVERVMRDAMPAFAAPRERLEGLRDQVARWDTATYTLDPHSVNLGHYGEIQAFLLGLLAIRLQDATLYEEQIAYLQRRGDAVAVGTPPYAFTRSLQAYRHWVGDSLDAAIADLDAGQLYVNEYCAACSSVHSQTINRYARAEILFEQERFEEAVRWYDSLMDGSIMWGVPYLGFAYLRKAAAAEARGDAGAAVENYTRLLELWKDPEPPFKSLRDEAARNMDRLLDKAVREPGRSVPPADS